MEAQFRAAAAELSAEERLSAFNATMMAGGMLSANPAEFGQAAKRRWLVGDYRAGDVVFHHPCMVHCSANNADPQGRIRLATDLRFADRAGAYDHRWADNYCA
jgi:phytanoyl-CoA hydroxylase